MPIRLERWIRSKLWAMTARTPSNAVPLAAQSRLPPSVLLARQHDQRHPSSAYAWRRRRWTSRAVGQVQGEAALGSGRQ